jgi:hypothetical protein
VELVQRAAVGGGHQVNARADVGDVVEVLRPAAVDVEERDLPLDLVEDRRAELREQLLIAVRVRSCREPEVLPVNSPDAGDDVRCSMT